MTRPVAAATVRLAVKLARIPATAEAFAAGDISRAHVHRLAGAYTRERAGELYERGTDEIWATLSASVNTDDLAKSIAYVTDAIDGDGGARADNEIYDKRTLHSSETMGGVAGTWFLDVEGGTIVNDALDAQMQTAQMDDDRRSTQQRRADALVDICRYSLAFGDHPPAASKRRRGVPNALLVADIRILEPTQPDLVADIRAEFASGGRLSLATIERILCDCDISRVIMDGPSEVLDLGRSTRIPSDKQFKALVVRDQHCQQPGCNVPWQFCQPHHKTWWTRGGHTNLDNLELLCWHHHRTRHKHDAQPRPG